MTLDRRNSYEISQMGDNTYATILPRSMPHAGGSGSSPMTDGGGSGGTGSRNDIADYATLRTNNSRAPQAVSHQT